jgi:hypothetical protein
MQVSSEAQLDTSSGNILICHQTLGASSAGDPVSRSLNDIVEEMRLLFGANNSSAGLDFALALVEAQYVRRPEYDENRWVLSSRRMYSVSEGFPRITPAMLSDGIERVTYCIRMESCKPFEIDVVAAMERVFG